MFSPTQALWSSYFDKNQMAIRNLSNIAFYTFSPVVTKISLGPRGGPMGSQGGPIGIPWVGPWGP